MASIDYQEAKKEITKMFQAEDSSERKIIFWYDPPMNFKEDILSDSFDCCRVLVCEKNEFSIKRTIEHDETDTNFLVYIPADKPADDENWLLDILMYSEVYYADTVALTMRRLGLSNPDLRRILERYEKFFDSEARNKKLGNYVAVNDQMSGDDLKMAMLCVLVKASSRSTESVLTELVFDSGIKYADVKKFGFEEYLWDEISRYYNYEGDQKIEILIRKFLFTALLEQKADFGDLPSFYQQYTIKGTGKMDAKFFVDKIKTDKRYPDLQSGLAMDLKIEGLLAPRDIASVQEADIFECIDTYIIKTIAESLKNGSMDYDAFDRIITNRMNSIWYEEHKSEYELLASSIAFFRILEKPIPKQLLSTEYIREYTKTYYKVDYYYRHICASYRILEHSIEEFEWLMDRVELKYQMKFLDVLGKEYSDSLVQQGEWRFAGIPMTTDFYHSVQKNNYKKCFVIISDGMRYEIAHELFERIQVDPILKGSQELSYAISPIPSETRFGMAALLPHQKISYSDGTVFTDSMPTNGTQARDAVLKAKNSGYAAINYEDIYSMSKDRPKLRSYMADKSLVYIYHNVIDNTGERDEKKVFDATEIAINEIIMLIRRLYNGLQISNFYITADHGFLYRSNTVEESSKYSNVISMHPNEVSRRYVLTNDSSFSIPYTLEFPLAVKEDGNKVVIPYSYDLFKTQGSGLQYIHGGASLQETVVPIIHIGELSSAKNKDAVTPVGVRLKSITRKITNRSFTLEFEQYEKVEGLKQAVSCETYIVDEDGNKVSGTYPFMAASASDEANTRVTSIRFTLMNIQFDRGKRYFLILRDTAKPDEYIEKEQFTIDILAFKVF